MEGLKTLKLFPNYLWILSTLVLFCAFVNGNEPDIDAIGGEFEAAFQGKCGPSSPCTQLCLELHDGTFECQCRPGYRLLLDGYSCVEINNSSYVDEEDEDENSSAELDSFEDNTSSPKLSKRVQAAKNEATTPPPTTVSTSSIDDFDGRPLPQNIASSSYQHPYKRKGNNKKDNKGAAIAAAAEAQEKSTYLKKFSPVDLDPNSPGLDFFGLEPKIMAKETAKSLIPSKSEKSLKTSVNESEEEDENDDSSSSESEEEEEDKEDEGSNEAEEDLTSLENQRKQSQKQQSVEDGIHGGEQEVSSEEESDFILPPRALPLNGMRDAPTPPTSFTPSQVKAEVDRVHNHPADAPPYQSPSPSPPEGTRVGGNEECPLKCNRGTCSKEDHDSYRCLCPMGNKGAFCELDEVWEEGGGYNSGLFRGQSWTAFPVLHDAYMSDQISLDFRPQSPNGILLLTGERDDLSGDYLALFLRDGFLEFRFDCGSGSGVVRSSNPVKLEEWNKASIIRRRWDGWMQLNDGPFTQGRSKGLFSRITFRQPVYIGGQGNITLNSIPSIQSNFEDEPELASSSSTPTAPSTETPTPFKEERAKASDGNNNVSSVGENKNGGRDDGPSVVGVLKRVGGFKGCIRNLMINDRSYRFGLEPAGDNIQGFDVENCNDQGVCDLVSCQHGGQCLVQKDQVQCLCPLGFSGQFCETALDLQIPSFNGSSYLKYGGLGLTRVLSWLELEVVIKPDSMDGLILYNGYKTDGMGDFISLIIDQGYIEFAMDLGTGAAIIRSDWGIALGEWHHIHISRTSRLISLRIDNQPPLMAMTPGAFTQLSLPHNLFLGGIPDPEWLSPKVKVQGGFTGCIQKLVINEKPLRIMGSAMSGVNLENCQHPCLRNPCDHGGDCVPQLDTFKCHCPLGFRDPFCQTRMDKEDLITAPKFIGDSYLRFTHPKIIKRLSGWRLNLSFRLKTESTRGLLIWAGRKWMTSASDFITVGLKNGFVTASFSLGSGQTTIAYNNTVVNDGKWHHVILVRNEQEASLSVDEGAPITGVAPGKLRQLNINDGLYVGGVEESRHHSVNRYNEGFMGCLTDLVLGSERVSMLQEASEGRNVDYCD